MTSEPVDGQPGAEVVQLRAVPADPAVLEDAPSGPPAYADITQPGDLKPILPPWLQSADALKHHARHHAGRAAHRAGYHGLRSPAYLAQALFWAQIGAIRLLFRWLHWWLFPVPLEVYQDAIADGHRHWHRTRAVHAEMSKTRAYISLAAAAVALLAGKLAWAHAPWWAWPLAGAAALVVLARAGRGEGRRIVQPARVPAAYEALTQDVITRALGALGLAGINTWLREGRQIDYVGPVRQDGPGWLSDMNLPYGVTVTEVIDRRAKLASGLRRPLGAVWPELVSAEHEGRMALWVGQQDVTTRRPVPWPLLKAGQADVFRPVPFGTDVRGRKVSAPLINHNWLIGSQPRNGKTGAVRELGCAAALDPLPALWIAELKGTGDLDALATVSHRFVSGIDDDSIAYAAESLALLRREAGVRSPKVKALPPDVCPDRKVTRQIAQRYPALRPIVCICDEAQNLFAHPKYGKQAGADAEFIIKVGPALGIVLILATQRPDAASLPTGVSGNVSIRFCLYVAGQTENDMVLGTSAYKNGLRATMFRPETDAGLGWLKGATPEPKVTRTHYMDVKEAAAVAARARAARERAGTLTGYAAGEDGAQAPRDVLGDTEAVFAGDPGLHWQVLADRLAQRFPDRWAGVTADAVSAQLRDLDVPSAQVKMSGANRQGCRKADVERVISERG